MEGGYGRTGSRSPMQWSKGLNAGFSAAHPDMLYIRQDSSEDRPDAESQMADEGSIYSEVKRLIAVRMANIALQSNAEIRWVSDGYPLIYKRICPEQQIMVIINPSSQPTEVECCGSLIYCVGSVQLSDGCAKLGGCSAAIIQL